jgi:hypothetical protein
MVFAAVVSADREAILRKPYNLVSFRIGLNRKDIAILLLIVNARSPAFHGAGLFQD